MDHRIVFKSSFDKFKMDEEKNTGTFTGYASTYNNSDRVGDIIIEDAFKSGLDKKSTYPMLFNHWYDKVIGKIEVSNDSKGLPFTATLNLNDPEAKKVYDLLKMGALDSMSVGFRVKEYNLVDDDKPWGGWIIKEAELYEVSVVTVPANPEATIDSVKSDIKKAHEEKMKDIDDMLEHYNKNLKGDY